MAQVTGIKEVINFLQTLLEKQSREKTPIVSVGYTANYALWVHENMTASHPVGQAKFLEEPSRTHIEDLRDRIRDDVQRGRLLSQALLRAGIFLQRESQKLCPVDTGALRASAFTRQE